VMGASQKGLMLQPGMAFVAANARAMAVADANPAPRFYWDWRRRKAEHSYQKFCGTPPLAHLAGLEAALALIDAAGHPALFVVDVVASLGAAPFAMDALGVNVAMGASQKGLMLQPGMAFVAVDERAMAVADATPAHRFYWDWQRRRSEHSYRKFCGTPPLSHLAGLEAALGLIAAEGLDRVHARHARLAHAVHAAVGSWSEAGAVRLFTKTAAARSVSVTAVEVTPGIDPEALRAVARERFQVAIAGGLGPLHGRVFRIGHLGDMNEAMILGCLAGVEAAMRVQGIAHGGKGVEAAIAALVD